MNARAFTVASDGIRATGCAGNLLPMNGTGKSRFRPAGGYQAQGA